MIWDNIVDRQTGILNFTPELNQAIKKTHVAVFGAGGNGAVLDFLARTGYQKFTTVDFDVVEPSNLNRLPFLPEYIGMPKVDAWKKYLQILNPDCQVLTYHKSLTRYDEALVEKIISQADIVVLNTSDFEANFVIARVSHRLKKPMIAGPGTANCWVVTTFTHEGDVSLESVGGFGTEGIAVTEIDYAKILPQFMKLYMFPGRADRLYPEVLDKVRAGEIAPRSCKMFVSLVNVSQCWEIVKNTARIHDLPLQGTQVIQFPVLQIFDPFKGSTFYWNAQTKEIGIPDWLSGEIQYRTLGTSE